MEQIRLFAATGDAVAALCGDPGSRLTPTLSLEGSGAQCLAADPTNPDRLFVGTLEQGLFRSRDGGRTWQRVGAEIPSHRFLSVAIAPARQTAGLAAVYVGTEPSNLYRSDDDGETWQVFPRLPELPSAPTWSFPPRPWTSHVRCIAPHPHDPDLLFVGIELGGVMRSRDGGETWEDRKPGSYYDSHALATHPAAPGHVYEAAGGGVSFSDDAGDTWRMVDDGMDRHYVWALAVDAGDPDLWYVSAAPSARNAHHQPGEAEAFIYRKRGTAPWQRLGAVQGLPEPFDVMPYALLAPRQQPNVIIAGLRNGELLFSTDAGDSWRPLDVRLPGLLSLVES